MSSREFGDVLLSGGNDAATARALGVSRSTIGRWRENDRIIPLGKLEDLAKLKGYTLILRRDAREYS